MAPDTISSGTIVILIGAAVAILAILTLILTRKLGTFLLLAGGVTAVVIVALAMLGQAEATQETAVASQETALAAQEAAQAATTATVGQTVVSFALVALVCLLAVVAIVAIVAVLYFWLRSRRAEAMGQFGGNWKSGPNALWGGRNVRARIPPSSSSEMLLSMLMQQMMMMMQQQMMAPPVQRGTPPAYQQTRPVYRQTPPAVPPWNNPALPLLSDQYVVDDGDEINAPAGWDWEA